MTNAEQLVAEGEQEISLNDIIDFFVTHWKFLLIGAALGFLIALGGTLLFGKYQAEATLVNKSGIERSGVERSGVDYLTWKSLRRNLPILAARISETTGVGESFLKVLSSEKWWQKNIVPTFAIAKDDIKETIGVSKEMQDAESTRIKDFVVKATGKSKENAIENLTAATSFFRSGAAYLALKDVIANYQIELLNSESEIAKNTTAFEVELAYLNRRMVDLESLRAKFPVNAASILQTLDAKDANSKYFPIITQLIAVNKDISELKEKISRLNNRKIQLAMTGDFLLKAKPVLDRNFDGLSAIAELMQIENSMRKNVQPSDLIKSTTLNNIKYDLVSIQTRFTLGLEQPTFISTSKADYLKPAAMGLFSGLFLALLGSFCSVVWLRYRRQTKA
jgi:hypothetical protein